MKKLFFISILLLSSCSKGVIQHPGAINSFDNYAYDTLIVEQAALNQAKPLVTQFPAIKSSLNTAIDEYNITMAAYKTYHTALQNGSKPSSAQLQASLTDLIGKVAAILKQTGAK